MKISLTASWEDFLKIQRVERVILEHTILGIICTRSFHFSPECTKIVSGWGSAPRPRWGSLQRSPRPPSCYGLGWRFGNNFFWGVKYVPPCSWPVPPCCFEAGYGPAWKIMKVGCGSEGENYMPIWWLVEGYGKRSSSDEVGFVADSFLSIFVICSVELQLVFLYLPGARWNGVVSGHSSTRHICLVACPEDRRRPGRSTLSVDRQNGTAHTKSVQTVIKERS